MYKLETVFARWGGVMYRCAIVTTLSADKYSVLHVDRMPIDGKNQVYLLQLTADLMEDFVEGDRVWRPTISEAIEEHMTYFDS